MPRRYQTLDEVFADDSEGLLKVAAASSAPTNKDRLIAGFEAINAFVDANGREPSEQGERHEKSLARRLNGLRARDAVTVEKLAAHDQHGLLSANSVSKQADQPDQPAVSALPAEDELPPQSLEDIFDKDDDLLSAGDSSLFEERHIKFRDTRNLPDTIAQRSPCEDFWRFESLFKEAREDIANGRASTERFRKSSYVEEGDFFILDGVLALVDHIGMTDQGSHNGQHNPRIRVIFDNATETNMLLLSFTRALYKDANGRRVQLDRDRALDKMAGLSHHDRRAGTIYILRSRTQRPELVAYPDLYKIGYTEESLEKRLSGAERSKTYLEAPVDVMATYECYNANPHAIERLVHAMLASHKLNVTLHSADGRKYRPREWFCVPLATAQAVVERIADGTLSRYRIDAVTGQLVEKTRKYHEPEG